MKLKTYHLRLTTIIIYLLITNIIGCDAFVRKFTRKPKKEDLPQEEMVLAPQDYKASPMSKEDLYRQYFLFWRSWQDELINTLTQKGSQKKQIECAEEVINNLNNLRPLLNEQAQKNLDLYITQLKELKELISKDLYSNSATSYAQEVERIKRNILKDFSYQKIKANLI